MGLVVVMVYMVVDSVGLQIVIVDVVFLQVDLLVHVENLVHQRVEYVVEYVYLTNDVLFLYKFLIHLIKYEVIFTFYFR